MDLLGVPRSDPRREVDAKQGKRIRMGLQIAHFPCVRTIEGFDFSFQPSADERLIRELSTGNFIAHGENVLIFGPPGVGKSHLAIGLGRKVVEQGHTVRFTTATALLSVLGKAESEGNLGDKLIEYSKPRLLIIDELGYLPFERRAAHLFFQLVNRRYEKGSLLVTTNQRVSDWGIVFGEGVIAPVPGIMRLFWAFSSSNPPESPSQEDSSLANMLDTLEARCRSDGPPAGPRSIDPLPGSRSFLTVSAVA